MSAIDPSKFRLDPNAPLPTVREIATEVIPGYGPVQVLITTEGRKLFCEDDIAKAAKHLGFTSVAAMFEWASAEPEGN